MWALKCPPSRLREALWAYSYADLKWFVQTSYQREILRVTQFRETHREVMFEVAQAVMGGGKKKPTGVAVQTTEQAAQALSALGGLVM